MTKRSLNLERAKATKSVNVSLPVSIVSVYTTLARSCGTTKKPLMESVLIEKAKEILKAYENVPREVSEDVGPNEDE